MTLLRPLTTVGRFAFNIRPRVHTALPERPCRPRGSKTVAQTTHARVFTIRSGKLTYTDGCVFRSRMHIQLGVGSWWEGEPEQLSILRFAGPFASYVLTRPEATQPWSLMVVTSLLNGARAVFGGDVGPVEVLGEVLTQTGTVAWVGHNSDDFTSGSAPTFSVRTLNASGSTLLDRGPDIDPHSLRLNGSTLTWLDGGVEQRATL
jgi:hypothetical protein